MARDKEVIWVKREAKNFARQGWTGKSTPPGRPSGCPKPCSRPAKPPSLIAPRDIDGLLLAVMARHHDGLRRTLRHVRLVGRRDHRREAVDRIPGNVIGVGITRIARTGLRSIGAGLAIPAISVPVPVSVSVLLPSPVLLLLTGRRAFHRQGPALAGLCFSGIPHGTRVSDVDENRRQAPPALQADRRCEVV